MKMEFWVNAYIFSMLLACRERNGVAFIWLLTQQTLS
jgi:hypothetical protein